MRLDLCVAAILALASGCAASPLSRPQVAYAEHEATAAQRVCPMDVPGTTAIALELDRGAGLAFVTAGDLRVLRDRVHALAELQNRSAMDGGAIASVQNIDLGALLVFDPAPTADSDDLQRDVLSYAERLAGGDCPMTRDQSAVVPARRPSVNPGQAPPPASTVPGVFVGYSISSLITNMPAGVGF